MKTAQDYHKVPKKLRYQLEGPKLQGTRRLLRHNRVSKKQLRIIEHLITKKNFFKLETYVKDTISRNIKLGVALEEASKSFEKERTQASPAHERVCPTCKITMTITVKGDLSKHTEPQGKLVVTCKACK